MNEKFDVVVIGGGPGGTPAAMQMAAAGKKVLLAEESGKLGGACLFVGCIPSKIIKHGADVYMRRNAGKTGIGNDLAWQEIKNRMSSILDGRSSGALEKLKMAGIKFEPGKARFVSASEVEVNGSRYSFDSALIATGARSFVPSFGGDGVKDALTSEAFFGMKSLPKSLMIIGGGPIGVEVAQMTAKLGVKCTIIEMMDELLAGLVEPEFGEIVSRKITGSGIDVYTGSKVEQINRHGAEFETVFSGKDSARKSIITEQVLVVAGKVPVIEGLGLQAAGIRNERGGIVVDDFLETSVPGIYAVGDVILNGPKFAHTATYEAHIAAGNILRGKSRKVVFDKNTWVLFSDPEIAAAGLTQARAQKSGIKTVTGTYDYREDATAQINGDASGFLKFIVEAQTGRIVGVHAMLNGAASLIGEASAIVSGGMTLGEVAQAIHPHPTLSEAFGFLAFMMLSGKNTTK